MRHSGVAMFRSALVQLAGSRRSAGLRMRRLGAWLALPLLTAAMLLALGACRKAGEASADAANEGHSRPPAARRRHRARRRPQRVKTDEARSAGPREALPLRRLSRGVYMPRPIRSQRDGHGGMRVVSGMSKGKVSGMFNDARKQMQSSGWKQTWRATFRRQRQLSSEGQTHAVLSFNRAQSGRWAW